MKVEHLVATMNRQDCAFLEGMGLRADAVVINQCGRSGVELLEREGRRVRFFSFPERGVGNSRNRALERAEGDILLFSDDDLTYLDGYREMLLEAFAARPEADAIVFNLRSRRPRRQIRRPGRVRVYNFMRYGAPRIAIRREAVIRAGLRFSTEFGGGARYGSGEDTLFLRDCLKRGLRVFALPITPVETDDAPSTWFTGYDARFFFDKGALMAALFGWLGIPVCAAFVLRHRDFRNPELSLPARFARMTAGLRAYMEAKT